MNSEKKKIKILTHSDTDGICSAILLERILEEKAENQINIELPVKFGNYREKEIDKEIETWMTDMRPVDKDFEGIVIDHHLDHFKDRKYKLMLDLKLCTTELLFALYKQQMKSKDSWLVVLGAIGDFAVQFLEKELKNRWLKLLKPLTKKNGNQFKFFLGGRMSALINSGCRINRAEETLNIIRNLKEPYSILNIQKLQEFRQIINKTVYSILDTNDIIKLKKGILFFEFSNEYNIGGRIASQLAERDNSVIVYNSYLKKISIRGKLSNYIATRLAGSEVGGHSVAKGGSVTDEFLFQNSILKNIGKE